jgi:DNA-binding PadR family transcriptional regulator
VTAVPGILSGDVLAGRAKEVNVSLARLDVILLGLLSTGDRTGYDVWKWFEGRGSFVGYSAKTSQIYRQLGRLVEWGWANPVHAPRLSGPDAKLYSLTDAGRVRLQEWIDSPYVPPSRPGLPGPTAFRRK